MPKTRKREKSTQREPDAPLPGRRLWDPRAVGGAVGLLLLTLVAYAPALSAGFIWDDPDYVINNANLRSPQGLANIWLDPSTSPQYYPMVYTTFWVEFQRWQLWAPGYHAVNVVLHAVSAILLWRLLRALGIPGAGLAACVFAVHPVHVESVAWITERKNVLSGLFYLAAFLAYVKGGFVPARDDDATAAPRRDGRLYAVALLLFVLALLSKTVTCSLPAAILLVTWWRRGTLSLRRDVVPLVPFFVIGAYLALKTAQLERGHVGAVGAEWDFSVADRFLIAGRAVWFYLWKLVWPVNLAFIYPRWTVDDRQAWQYLFPAAAAGLVVALFLLRHRIGRAPLVAALFFGGTLFPALGFFNVYPMRYSFVADHFQYHASLGAIVLLAALLWRYVKPPQATFALLAPLVVLTAMQARHYENAETLWRDTLAKNPRSWMVHTNLANALADQQRYEEAAAHYAQAVKLAPHLAETHWNVGTALTWQGRYDEALAALDEAVRLDPKLAGPYYQRGMVYWRQERVDDAKRAFQAAVNAAPGYADAHFMMGRIAEQAGDLDAAIAHYTATVTNKLGDAEAHYNLGNVLRQRGRLEEALVHYSQSIRIDPRRAEAHANFGATLLQLGRYDEAIRAFQFALRINPLLAPAQRGLQRAQELRGMRPTAPPP